MSQPAISASTPTPLLRRAVTWWLAQVKHALPPTIFFFVGLPDPMDQTPDPAGARHRVQWLLHRDSSGVAGRKSRFGNRQPAVYAPFRRCAHDPAHLVQERDILGVR